MTRNRTLAARLREVAAGLADAGARSRLEALAAEVADLESGRALSEELALATSKLAELSREAAEHNHELRQPLLAIKAMAEFVLDDVRDAGKVASHALIIREQAERMTRLVARFGDRSVHRSDDEGPADVCHAVRAVAALLEYRLARVSLQLDVPDEPVWVTGGGDRLEQILMNLMTNAIDAVSGRERRGNLTVRVRAGAGEVRVYVADDGPGVPERVRARLFEPFFTTKEPGKGSGLGLVITRELARAAGGTVDLCDDETIRSLAPWSHPVTTVFRVVLPAAAPAEEATCG